jgi:hypothetical protein
MATNPDETVQSDPVMNIFRTFALLEKQSINTRLEVCDHSQYAFHILQAAIDFGCNFVIFPINIGAQTYPNGWNSAVIDILYAKANFTVGILCDRGYGTVIPKSRIIPSDGPVDMFRASSSPAYRFEPHSAGGSSGRSRTSFQLEGNALEQTPHIVFPFFGENADDIGTLSFLSLLSSSVHLDIVVMTEMISEPLQEFMELAVDNPCINFSYPDKKNDLKYDRLTAIIDNYDGKDLVVLSNSTFTIKSSDGSSSIKEFMITRSKASFLVVHTPAQILERMSVDLRRSTSMRMTSSV